MRIVAGVDESAGSQRALEWALGEARAHQYELRLVHAIPPSDALYPYSTLTFEAVDRHAGEAKAAAQEMLADVLAKAGGADDVNTDLVVRSGLAADVLLEESGDAALVVVGSRGRGGFTGLLLGSVSQQVVQHARCPVVVIPAHAV